MLLDVKAERAAALAQRLGLYRLRARVAVEPTSSRSCSASAPRPQARSPTRGDPGLGWRAYVADRRRSSPAWRRSTPAELEARRIALGVPETGVELLPDDSYILEMGFERLNGVDFRKGCYVGQEVTARMKHKTELRKGLARVRIEGRRRRRAPRSAPAAGRGTLLSRRATGLAYLRFDRAKGELTAGAARVRRDG